MKQFHLFKRLFSSVSFPYSCRLGNDENLQFRGARFESREGDELQIVHVPTHELPHAVFVYSVPLNRVLGQLTQHSAKTLIRLLGKGFCVDGELYARVQSGEDFHIDLLVFDRRSLMKNADFSSLHE